MILMQLSLYGIDLYSFPLIYLIESFVLHRKKTISENSFYNETETSH